MDILNNIILSMNKEEVRHFKLFAARTQVDGVRKDIHLFDYIRKIDGEYDEDKVFRKLYKTGEKNPFYRLKNRLLGDLNKSLILQYVDEDESLHTFHLLSLARFFQNRNNFKVALHYIRKAEKKAIGQENYELLDFIYSELIKLSHEVVTINPEDYIRLRKENRDKLNVLREIDDILAAVIYRIKVSQNFSDGDITIFSLLQKTVDDYAQNPRIKENPKLRFTLYHAVSRILLARKDFVTLEEYLLKTYTEFTDEGLFNKGNHDTRLQMLVYIINALFKNRKHEKSLEYTALLSQAMEEFNRLHYKKYLFFYYNSLVINYSRQDFRKAIPILEEIWQNGVFKDNSFYEFWVMANLAVSYYRTEQYQKAIKTLVKVFIHDGYQTANEALRLRFAVFELVLRLETDEFDLVEKRLDKISKEFRPLLDSNDNLAEVAMLNIIRKMNKSADPLMDKALVKEARLLHTELESDEAPDVSFLDYSYWLRSKFMLQK